MTDTNRPSKTDLYRRALERVAKWFGEFPDTGRTWDDGEPMSYSACFGSNGERDYMRQVAIDALATAQHAPDETTTRKATYRDIYPVDIDDGDTRGTWENNLPAKSGEPTEVLAQRAERILSKAGWTLSLGSIAAVIEALNEIRAVEPDGLPASWRADIEQSEKVRSEWCMHLTTFEECPYGCKPEKASGDKYLNDRLNEEGDFR